MFSRIKRHNKASRTSLLSTAFSLLCLVTCLLSMQSCDDGDTFSSSYSNMLTIKKDTLSLDTVFSKVPSAYKMIMVHNTSGSGIHINYVRQERGARQTGFLVNVNGTYIDPDQNNRTGAMDLRDGDSLRIFVELNSPFLNESSVPEKKEDNLIFHLESGREQKINLNAWTWDADTLQGHHIAADSTIDNAGKKPLIVYGTLTVDTLATLTIAEGSTVYFHQDGGINVKGRLLINGSKDKPVTLRCDRLDSLLQLRYDQIPGKWRGITFSKGSYENVIDYADIHGSEYGILCDSTYDLTRQKLTLTHSMITNTLGNVLENKGTAVTIENSLLANARGYCLKVTGGYTVVNSSTLASFYAYSTGRRNALLMSAVDNESGKPELYFRMTNSIVSGLSDDEVYMTISDTTSVPDVLITNSLLRTSKPGTGIASKMLVDNLYDEDSPEDYRGRGNFTHVNDTGTDFMYDFTPKEGSPAVNAANAVTSAADDIKGRLRKATPDMGCYETEIKEQPIP